MKRVLKFLGIGILGILSLLGIILLYIGLNDIPSYTVEKVEYHVKSTPESIKRGSKLASMLCVHCHLNNETGKLTGKRMLDTPPEFGEIYSMNITHDRKYGIGNWTDGELVYLLRTGIKKGGQYSPPYMAKLPNMADEDINAIISFLRSDNPKVMADATPNTPSKPSLLTKILCWVAFRPFPIPTQTIMLPDTTNAVALGKYVAYNLDCFSCHSANFTTNNYINPPLSKGYFGGGNKPLDMKGRVMFTPNLTPDMETGIGKWTKASFIQAVKYGLVKGQNALTYPMMPYSELSDNEVGAIYEYLRTIPPIKNKVIRSVYD